MKTSCKQEVKVFFQFFGNRAAVLEPTELLNRPDSKLLLFWSFFFCAALRLLFSNEISQKSKRPAAEAVATIGDLLRCLISRKTVALINLGSHAKKNPLRIIRMTDFDPVVDGGHSQIVSEESVSERQMSLLFWYSLFLDLA